MEKDDIYALSTKSLMDAVVHRKVVDDILTDLIQPFAQAVLDAQTPDATIVHKNRYDAVVVFGNQILERVKLIAEVVEVVEPTVQYDS